MENLTGNAGANFNFAIVCHMPFPFPDMFPIVHREFQPVESTLFISFVAMLGWEALHMVTHQEP